MLQQNCCRRSFLKHGGMLAASAMVPCQKSFGQTMPKMAKRNPTGAEIARVQKLHQHPPSILFQDDFRDPGSFANNWSIFTDDRADLQACRTAASLTVSSAGLKIDTIAVEHHRARWSTGEIISKASFQYGLYEAYLKITPAAGVDNAFWLTSEGDLRDGTGDSFEIDIAETSYPDLVRSTLHRHNLHGGGDRYETGYVYRAHGNLASGLHDYGVLWTPETLVFCLDGQAFQTVETQGTINVPANLRLSTALASFAGQMPDDPVGLAMLVSHVRVVGLDGSGA